MAFLHDFRCKQIFGKNPKLAKVYGEYFHGLISHLPTVSRVIAPSSLYTEQEERIFGGLRAIGLATSQRGVESVRDIGIVRYIITKVAVTIFLTYSIHAAFF